MTLHDVKNLSYFPVTLKYFPFHVRIMNQADLRFTGGRKLSEAQIIKAKKLGGLGVTKTGTNGAVEQYVTIVPGEKKGENKLAVANYHGYEKPKMSQYNRDHQRFLEDLMEKESSGRHPRVKPSEAKKAKKRLKQWVEDGRPVQGVHV